MWFDMSFKRVFPIAHLAMVALSTAACSAYDPYSTIYHFPDTPFTDIENVAARSNGQLLLDTITGASTYLLDPNKASPTPQLLQTYPGATSSLGIAETQADVFAIVVGNYSAATLEGVPGSFAVWSLDLRAGAPGVAKKITAIPEAHALNGATTASGNANIVLIADSALGAIWRVDVSNGAYSKVLQDPAFAPAGAIPLGINGIHSHGADVYFTNSAKGTFGKLPVSSAGIPTGSPTIIATTLSPNYTYDDFAIDASGNAFVTNHPNQLTRITPSGSQSLIESGASFDQPSSAAFGRAPNGLCTLYVVTAGTPGTDSGAVISVQTCT